MATAKQLAALKKARAAKKKKAPVKNAASKRKKNPVKKNRKDIFYVMTLVKNHKRVGYWFSGHWDDTNAARYPNVDALRKDIPWAKRHLPSGYGIAYEIEKK